MSRPQIDEKNKVNRKMINAASFAEIWEKSWRSSPATQFTLRSKEHINTTMEWIKQACVVVDDGGMSKGYDLLRNRWAPSYPETTGYTIPTLFNVAAELAKPELRTLAYRLAEYLLQNTTEEGGVAHWESGSRGDPVVFDSGQVTFGWLAAFECRGDLRYLKAATKAGDWLVSVQDSSGAWHKYQHDGVVKVIDTRVAWALLTLGRHVNNKVYTKPAVNNLNWALQQQDNDGWFRNCAFSEKQDPFTPKLAYTAEGLLECGLLASYVAAAQLTAGILIARQKLDGSLAGTYSSGWRVSSPTS